MEAPISLLSTPWISHHMVGGIVSSKQSDCYDVEFNHGLTLVILHKPSVRDGAGGPKGGSRPIVKSKTKTTNYNRMKRRRRRQRGAVKFTIYPVLIPCFVTLVLHSA